MTDALEEHDGKAPEKLPACGLQMTQNALTEGNQEIEAPDGSLDKTCTRYEMRISAG